MSLGPFPLEIPNILSIAISNRGYTRIRIAVRVTIEGERVHSLFKGDVTYLFDAVHGYRGVGSAAASVRFDEG